MTVKAIFLFKLWLTSFLLLPCTGCLVAPVETIEPAAAERSYDGQGELLALINKARTKGCRCGSRRFPAAPPLRWSNQLEIAARRHARDMNRNTFFDHRGSDGSTIGDRISAAGYRWRAVAENIAWGQLTRESVVQGWLDSPGHCRNIMNPAYEEMSIVQEGSYWVQTFGSEMGR